MQPVEIGVRRKIDLDPTIATTAHPYVPMYNNHMWERVLKIGNQMWVGEETGLWFEPGDHVYPCTGTIFDYYPFTEMQRVVLNEDGEEIQVEGPGNEINETTQSNIMVRCPKVFFKDEWTVEEEGVWGYEYHWMCKYKADNLYYVDAFHVRNDGQVFNGYCYVGSYYAVPRSAKPYSYKNTNTPNWSNLTDLNNDFTNKRNGTSSGKPADWRPNNINFIFGYLKKISLIALASSYPCYKTAFSTGYPHDSNIQRSLIVQPNDFYLRFGRYINMSNYGFNCSFNMYINKGTYGNDYEKNTCFGMIIYNGELYYTIDYQNNIILNNDSSQLSNWTKASYYAYNNTNYYFIRCLNNDNNNTWIEWPSLVVNTNVNGAPYYSNNPQGFWHGWNAFSCRNTSANVVYNNSQKDFSDTFSSYYFYNTYTNSQAEVLMLCYPYDLNGTGTPTTNENVLIEGSVPAQGATIETTDTITYTFNNDSVKPAIYDLSNKNMLVGRFADGRFTFGSQYEGDVVWTASTKQISIRRKQGWLTGSCNLWFQAADDQT